MTSNPIYSLLPMVFSLIAIVGVLVVASIACMTMLAVRRRMRAAAAVDELRYELMLADDGDGSKPAGSVPPSGPRA